MKKAIAIITIPALLLISNISTANSDSMGEHSWGEGKHSQGEQHNQKNGEKFAARKLKKLSKKLNLSKDQETKLKALFDQRQSSRKDGMQQRTALHNSIRTLDPKAADYATQLAAVKQQAGVQAQNKIDKMMSMRESLQQILTPEQYTKMQNMKNKHTKGNKHKS